jgi:phage baseplate assembly protein W
MPRHDYAFPFRIDPASRQGQRAAYPAHVEQLVRQLLLTSPGERADLPEFGCGIRALIFAPSSPALAATTQLLVQQALVRWLSDHLTVTNVEVIVADDKPEQILLRIEYVLLSTRTTEQVEVVIL